MLERLKALEVKIASKKVIGPVYGLGKGLSITLRTMMKRSITVEYPKEMPQLPARSRGVIALKEENCTVCMLCSRECPDWCIYIDSHKDVMPPKTPGARARTRNVLDRFAIDFALCMYCGICVEVCPFDALFWSPHFEYSETEIDNLTHEMPTLAEWVEYVPPPPELEDGAEPPKELEAEIRVIEAAASAPAAAAAAVAAPATAPSAAPTPEPEPPTAPEPETPSPPAAAAGDHEPPGIDEETYQRELAAGKPERVARALAKRASVLKRKQG
jgi:NADH-quinone oxidoreductase subunit I